MDIRGSMRIVDFAAAYRIAAEAGATVTSEEGAELSIELDLKSRFSYVASANRELHTAVLAELARR